MQRIEGKLNKNMYVREVLKPEFIPFLQGILTAIFQQDNARLHVTKAVRDFCSAQHKQILPYLACSADKSPTEHLWDLIGQRIRDLRLAASKDQLCCITYFKHSPNTDFGHFLQL